MLFNENIDYLFICILCIYISGLLYNADIGYGTLFDAFKDSGCVCCIELLKHRAYIAKVVLLHCMCVSVV